MGFFANARHGRRASIVHRNYVVLHNSLIHDYAFIGYSQRLSAYGLRPKISSDTIVITIILYYIVYYLS